MANARRDAHGREAHEILDDLMRTMPVSLERVQVGAARKVLIRAQSTCASTIETARRAMERER